MTGELEELLADVSEPDSASVDQLVERIGTGPLEPASVGAPLLALAGRVLVSEPAVAARALDLLSALAEGDDRADRWVTLTPAADYLRARIAVIEGRPADGLALIDAAREGWLAAGRPLEALRTHLGRVNVCNDLGRHDEAARTAQQLLAELDELADLPAELGPEELAQAGWLRGAGLENLGAAQGLTGRFDAALENHRLAEEVYQVHGQPVDVARCQANLGVTLVNVGRAVDGLAALEAAAEEFQRAGDRWSRAKCLGHIADALLLLARYGACLERCEQARAELEDLGATTEWCRIGVRTMRAYLSLNLVEEAEGIADEVEPELTELGLVHDLAECCWLRALAQLRLGRPVDAIALLDRAEAAVGSVDDPPLLVRILVARSEAAAATGDADGARRSASDAVELVGAGTWPTEELQASLQLAICSPADDAEPFLQRAEVLASELGLPHLRYPVLLELGRFERRRGDQVEARRRFEQAVSVVEGLRGLLTDEALRTSYLSGRTAAHGELITLLLDDDGHRAEVGLGAAMEAFDLAERSKARSLEDLLSGVVGPSGPLDQPTTEQHDLDAAYNALIAGGRQLPADRRQVLQRRAVDLERRVLVEGHRARAGRPAEVRPAPEAERAHPGPGERLVEYHVAGDEVVAFVWVDGRLRVAEPRIPLAALAELTDRWERQLGRHQVQRQIGPAHLGPLASSATAVLADLWELVFAPVEALLGDEGAVIIVPHGLLHAVPFHALVGPGGPVIDRWTISLAPSYRVARRLTTTAAGRRAHGRSLVVGVPDEAAPAVEGEAIGVAAALTNPTLLIGPEATRDRIRVALAQPHDVVHLACHGLHRAANPMFSALRLADGWLTAADVLSLRLDGSLVVLSACESGRQGGQDHLDETVGLARSFLAAGASTVVVSLWLAGDQITAELMASFYRQLAAGRSAVEALRRSQVDLSIHHAHPGDWAPFVVHGYH